MNRLDSKSEIHSRFSDLINASIYGPKTPDIILKLHNSLKKRAAFIQECVCNIMNQMFPAFIALKHDYIIIFNIQ